MHRMSCTAGHQGPESFYHDIGAPGKAKQVRELSNQLKHLNQWSSKNV